MAELGPALSEVEHLGDGRAGKDRGPQPWARLLAALVLGALGGWVLAAHVSTPPPADQGARVAVVLTQVDVQGVNPVTRISTARLTGILVNAGTEHENVPTITWGDLDNRVDLALDPGGLHEFVLTTPVHCGSIADVGSLPGIVVHSAGAGALVPAVGNAQIWDSVPDLCPSYGV